MSATGVRVHRDTYLDSLLLMSATAAMDGVDGVAWAGATMATPRGLDDLGEQGFAGDELAGLGGNDLVLAVRADDDDAVERALAAGEDAAFAERSTGADGGAQEPPPATVAAAAARLDGGNVAVVSVPGDYAALTAHHALTAGLHVLLFSDNVPVDQEVELKQRAARLGRLVMGPGAGTAVLAGTGLGFANVLAAHDGPAVGVVAAAGTGAQEVSALLDRWGVRVSHVIGVGGRDLSEAVGGLTARPAVAALAADPSTEVVLLVSKPPSPGAAEAVLRACAGTPAVAVFLGLDDLPTPDGVRLAPTLEEGAVLAARLAGGTPPSLAGGLDGRLADACARLPPGRTTVRGLFSGGTLCYEAQLVLERLLGPVHSNEPLRKEQGLPAPPGAHVLLDLGAEEYTVGRPHPMIDPTRRLEMLTEVADDPEVAVVLLDVVLGHGSAPDPAGDLAPALARLAAGDGPCVIASVLGTEGDPQVRSRQVSVLQEAGCLVATTNARAAAAAAALVLRRPELAGAGA